MKKLTFRSRHQSEEMALQITSMADIFTIILVFLLKSYATSAVNVTPTAGLLLPEAHAGDAPIEAVRVEISKEAVQVDGLPVVKLTNFDFDKSDLQPNGA